MSSQVKYFPDSANQENQISGDPIEELPVDQSPLESTELQIINTLFRKQKKNKSLLFIELKETIIVTVIVILVSMPQVDILIKKIFPVCKNSPYILLLIKGIITAILFLTIKHFYLSRIS